MAQCLEVYCGGDGAKTTGKGPKKFKNQKKGNVAQVEGSSFGGTIQVVQVVKKPQPKKGKAGAGSGGKKTKRGGTEESAMPQLWWRPLLAGLQGVEGN